VQIAERQDAESPADVEQPVETLGARLRVGERPWFGRHARAEVRASVWSRTFGTSGQTNRRASRAVQTAGAGSGS
jgi:hypothetical protein